jgi:hypothetical protein
MWKIVVPLVAASLILVGTGVYLVSQLRESHDQLDDLQDRVRALEAEVAILRIPETDTAGDDVALLCVRTLAVERRVASAKSRFLDSRITSRGWSEMRNPSSITGDSVFPPAGCFRGDIAVWDFGSLSC